jgi:hypothetical protein
MSLAEPARMKALLAIALLAATLTACADDKPAGRSSTGAVLATPDAVLASAGARTDAMCACADAACRTAVMSRPDDPFGEKGRGARDRFTAEQRAAWNDVMRRWAECSMRK